MKPCEEDLVTAVTQFHDELIKYERSLFNARVQAQVKLRKEVESYVEPKLEVGYRLTYFRWCIVYLFFIFYL